MLECFSAEPTVALLERGPCKKPVHFRGLLCIYRAVAPSIETNKNTKIYPTQSDPHSSRYLSYREG
jgi:hypothetical protein